MSYFPEIPCTTSRLTHGNEVIIVIFRLKVVVNRGTHRTSYYILIQLSLQSFACEWKNMLIFYCQHNPLRYIFLLQMWNRNFRRNSRQQVVSLSRASCVSPVELIDRKGGRGWARSQIIRTQESLVLYKSFNTHWFLASCHSWNTKASLLCLEEKFSTKIQIFLSKKSDTDLVQLFRIRIRPSQ
jgi:hypothetical protein